VLEITRPRLDVLFARHDRTEAVVTNDARYLPDVLCGFLATIDEAGCERRAWHRRCLWIVVIARVISLGRGVSWADCGRMRGGCRRHWLCGDAGRTRHELWNRHGWT